MAVNRGPQCKTLKIKHIAKSSQRIGGDASKNDNRWSACAGAATAALFGNDSRLAFCQVLVDVAAILAMAMTAQASKRIEKSLTMVPLPLVRCSQGTGIILSERLVGVQVGIAGSCGVMVMIGRFWRR